MPAKNAHLKKAQQIRLRALRDKELTKAAFQNHLVKDGDELIDTILKAFDVRLRPGIYPMEMALRSVQTSNQMTYTEFCTAIEKLSLSELSNARIKSLFDKYAKDGRVNFSNFIQDIVQRKKQLSKANFQDTVLCGSSQAAVSRKQYGQVIRNRELVQKSFDMDVEQLLLEKIEQRQKPGANSCGLTKAFRKFDTSSAKSVIGIDEFKERMKMMGLAVSDTHAQELMDKYDVNNSGNLDFKEFCDGVMKSYAQQNSLNISGSFLTPKMVALKRNAEKKREAVAKKSWNTLKLDFRKTLLEKIEQRVNSQYQLRAAFRQFGTGNELARIHFPEFKRGIAVFGLALSDTEALEFFKSLTDGGDCIDYKAFSDFFCKGKEATSLSPVDASNLFAESESVVETKESKHRDRGSHHRHKGHNHCRHRRKHRKSKRSDQSPEEQTGETPSPTKQNPGASFDENQGLSTSMPPIKLPIKGKKTGATADSKPPKTKHLKKVRSVPVFSRYRQAKTWATENDILTVQGPKICIHK